MTNLCRAVCPQWLSLSYSHVAYRYVFAHCLNHSLSSSRWYRGSHEIKRLLCLLKSATAQQQNMCNQSARAFPLQSRHNERDGVSNHQPHDCLLNCLHRRRSRKAYKFRVTGLCAGNSPLTGEFPAQMASYAENVSITDVIMLKLEFTDGDDVRQDTARTLLRLEIMLACLSKTE